MRLTLPVVGRGGIRARGRAGVRAAVGGAARAGAATLAAGAAGVALVLDPPQHAGGRPGRDRERLDVVGDDAVGADHAALAYGDAAGDRDAEAEPAVVADARGPLGLEALPGDRLIGVVDAVVRVG